MLESVRRLRSCCQTPRGMTHRNVDCVMTNQNEDKTKRWEGIKLLPIKSHITALVPILSHFLMKTNDHTLTTRKAIIGLTDWCTELEILKKKKNIENSS